MRRSCTGNYPNKLLSRTINLAKPYTEMELNAAAILTELNSDMGLLLT